LRRGFANQNRKIEGAVAAVIRVVAAVKPGACAAGEVEGVSALKRQAKNLSGGESLMSQCRGCLHFRKVPALVSPFYYAAKPIKV
jgi:hypothetical protein